MSSLYYDFMMSRTLGMSFAEYSKLSQWERTHQFVFSKITPGIEAWAAVGEELDISIREWMELSEEERQGSREYDDVADLMKLRGIKRREFMSMIPEARKIKIKFARENQGNL